MEGIIPIAIVLIVGACCHHHMKKRKLNHNIDAYAAAPGGHIEVQPQHVLPMHAPQVQIPPVHIEPIQNVPVYPTEYIQAPPMYAAVADAHLNVNQHSMYPPAGLHVPQY